MIQGQIEKSADVLDVHTTIEEYELDAGFATFLVDFEVYGKYRVAGTVPGYGVHGPDEHKEYELDEDSIEIVSMDGKAGDWKLVPKGLRDTVLEALARQIP